MKSVFIFMVFIVALFVVGQTCVAKGNKATIGTHSLVMHVIPEDIQQRVNGLAAEVETLRLHRDLAKAKILARQNAINYILDMWKVSVGILEVEFPNWIIEGDKLVKKQ